MRDDRQRKWHIEDQTLTDRFATHWPKADITAVHGKPNTPPMDESDRSLPNKEVAAFNAEAKKLMTKNDVYVVDCHDFYEKQLRPYLRGTSEKLDAESRSKLVSSIADAIRFFGN